MATRRGVLKGLGALGALGIFAAGYAPTLRKLGRGWWSGRKPRHPVYGDALPCEAAVNAAGEVTPSGEVAIAHAVCHGCTTLCGVRVVKDARTGVALRALGNPYHPLSADPPLPYATPVRESHRAFTPSGQASRGVMCARGNDAFEKMSDPLRVRAVLKRAGPRGSGRWRTIPFDEAIREISRGGRLFAEAGEDREVPGLASLRDVATPLDPGAPELGPRANQLGVMASFDDGRIELVRRFVRAFGTANMWEHRGTCALTMRAGAAALLSDWKGQPHLKPDFEHCEFALFFGTSPGQAGNPFKRQAQLLAGGRTSGPLRYAVVDPVQHGNDVLAAGDRARWVPIRPGTDAALALAIGRWILEHDAHDARYLAAPSLAAAAKVGEPSFSGATWLVVSEPSHERHGAFLRAAELGLGGDDAAVVVDAATGKPAASTACDAGALFFDGEVWLGGRPVRARTALSLYRESALGLTLAQASEVTGVPVATIEALASELTRHGKRVAVDAHGGTMHAGGFQAAWAALALNGLLGNLGWKGGVGTGGDAFPAFGEGPRYDLAAIPGGAKPRGVKITRESDYRETSEFRANGFPARAPWFPFGRALQGEVLASALDGYPYPLRALVSFDANPLYGAAGLDRLVRDRIADPERLPLFVAVDPFLNETSRWADYVFPDSVMYESWGVSGAWGAVQTRLSSTRYPAVVSPLPRTAAGDPVDGDAFLVELAMALGLPGFGDAAIPLADGTRAPLRRPGDFYLRAFANVAFAGAPVPDASEEDAALTGVRDVFVRHPGVLTPEEERKVAMVLSRGGRFQPAGAAYEGEWLARRWEKPVAFHDEALARTPRSQTGRPYAAVPTWEPAVGGSGEPLDAAFGREWPLRLVSYKSQTHSSMHPGTRIRSIRARNAIELCPEDARRCGVVHGGRARIETPAGVAEGVVRVRAGIAPGVVALEHGFGHWGFGAEGRVVDGEALPADARRGLGIAHNRLVPGDPTLARPGLLTDSVTGAAARQAIPARVVRA
ncbi:molydopterin dinucleotide-binding region [Anaeromyxobacter dehalogenans 2CP-1]|uniref:Molydopterin dinucleotide-binding region n=1 Tax=Anaeromyxobacter dehalogenans (strain ATCC BAA-258 / DSM 21875 / 2CP-1) TaxID=455488 RepID=B8J6G0_ANAD2|nr:molybdopterin dinucleotide binding domain-containing protein [Anaeromyxobacter dehalogenans]ACL65141.1 molydopterin dinucleotide-binding region [Anaeromyxobacter dehalogenans 2CP-1]